MLKIASLNRDGDAFDLEIDPKVLENKQITGGRLVASFIQSITFRFDEDGQLSAAEVQFSIKG